MKQMLIVGLGGFVGAVGRYKLGGWVLHHSADWRFPLSTFAINVVGCLIIGVLSGLAEKHDLFSPDARLFWFPGVLGGFTTFSAFSYEGLYLLRRGEILVAVLYAALSVIGGLIAVWLGMKLIGGGHPTP
jgi:fluoride exporter